MSSPRREDDSTDTANINCHMHVSAYICTYAGDMFRWCDGVLVRK